MAQQEASWADIVILKKKFIALELEALDTLSRPKGSFGADQRMLRVALLDLQLSVDALIEQLKIT